jgi:beta-glucan synthesis-associated protein KRE6
MVYYDPSAITTRNGSLEISLTKEKINGLDFKASTSYIRSEKEVDDRLVQQSGMLSSWSKVCFTGGRVEARVQLPG